MIPTYLAEITNEASNVITNGAVVAVCSMVTGVVAWFMRGKQQRTVQIEGTPEVNVKNEMGVRLHDAWVSRTEFMEFKGEIKADVREMRGTFDKLATIIDERDRKLSDMIEKVAAGAYEGRRRIHEEVNAQGKAIAVLSAKGDIGRHIGTLGKALMARPCIGGRQAETKPPTPAIPS
jgi:hypothetical protein